MATNKTAKKVIFVFHSYQNNVLSVSVYNGKKSKEISTEITLLDQDLLPFINKNIDLEALAGVAVVPSLIQGFSSSRLIYTSLNIIAWLQDVPIQLFPASVIDNNQVRDSLCEQMLSGKLKFSEQLDVQYQHPVDITPSKKKKRCHIGR